MGRMHDLCICPNYYNKKVAEGKTREKKMEVIIYLLIFIMGTFFGSFFTLATYRMPIGENITYKQSFCPNCKHKLGIWDLIPIFSYVFLGGKCRYCKQPIKIRYLLFEVLSGFVFLLFALSLRIDLYQMQEGQIICFVFGILYLVSLFLIAGIDKETNKIQCSVLLYGLVVVTCYILYLYIVQHINIYRYVIYLVIMLVLVLADTITLRKKAESNYTIQILTLCIYLVLFSGEQAFVLTVAFTLLLIAIQLIVHNIKAKKQKIQSEKISKLVNKKQYYIPIGFYLCASNIFVILLAGFFCNYILY